MRWQTVGPFHSSQFSHLVFILLWLFNENLNSFHTRVGKLFKGGNYMRKYGTYVWLKYYNWTQSSLHSPILILVIWETLNNQLNNNVLSFISGFLECLARKNPRSWTYQHRPIFSTEFILDMTTNQTNFWVRPFNRLQQYSLRPKIFLVASPSFWGSLNKG